MHPHEVEFKIRNLSTVSNYRGAERILIELKNYSGPIDEDQLSRFCFAVITNEQVYNCYNCKGYLNIILNKYKDKIDESQYEEIEEIINK
ncbi:MAG: hypothetical protein IJH63_09235 [Methanobrevibacter sp.]|uniref:Uncharacterized protein n=1 Tax=Methanobrevibacter millerae TaxID=230361 RepID=A0A8T3VH23_9EURY|nr:hypothetical protein [Methanobrevibacter millerae]MBE6505456.1 hypothetical protein [Methanobrevibacter millerae]MBR0057740.1 hypothetical protein [Methanobrevibacter sp.]MBR0370884.1 hypothetical protein [Methanobrevibacter sp.]